MFFRFKTSVWFLQRPGFNHRVFLCFLEPVPPTQHFSNCPIFLLYWIFLLHCPNRTVTPVYIWKWNGSKQGTLKSLSFDVVNLALGGLRYDFKEIFSLLSPELQGNKIDVFDCHWPLYFFKWPLSLVEVRTEEGPGFTNGWSSYFLLNGRKIGAHTS